MFSNRDLKNMIVPLFFEQLLVMLVGIMDTFIVSYVGEAAVSGVSLVNSYNIYLSFYCISFRWCSCHLTIYWK